MERDPITKKEEQEVTETDQVVKSHDHEGRTTLNQYTFTKKLGEGTFGKVKLAHKSNVEDKVAIKILKKDALKKKREMVRDEHGRIKFRDAFENVLKEIAIMKKLYHKNLVRLYEVIDNSDSCKLYLVMEVAEKGQMIEWDEDNQVFYNLHQKESIEEDRLRQIFAEIIQGLNYLHKNGIVHRDLKPQNILQSADGTTKIADFGVADIVGDNDILTKTEGTYHFLAPECVDTEGTQGYSGKAADIWAMGVTFYAFAYYKVPFNSEDTLELFEKIRTQELEFPEDQPISPELKDLLKRTLEKDPNKRAHLEYKIADSELSTHPWFQKSNFGEELAKELSKANPVTVTKEEIRNAITPMGNIIMTKLIAKKMVNNFRKGSHHQTETKEQGKTAPL